MNIADAKKQVKDTVEAYLAKDDAGLPAIAPVHQRPIFLIGAPGIGKTAIMEQVAQELGIGLVSYSMTHHTRQSALGLPLIEHREFEGIEYDASEYTMSEIIASMYDYMKKTGLSRGILFLDEINCVSETLYPSMLQFLQFKTFGRHHVPDDWIVVCAGNPPEYNKSVHEFDIVTLDRLRKIEVDPDYAAWRVYAQESDVHPAITTFLEIKKDCFYSVESKPGVKSFVTARGWSDLSEIIVLFEHMQKPIDINLVSQFLQDDEIAEQFAVYYDLFNKYRSDYQIDKILAGDVSDEVVDRAKAAPFDERVALLGLLFDPLGEQMGTALQAEQALVRVRDEMREVKQPLLAGATIRETVAADAAKWEATLARGIETGTKPAAEVRVERRAITLLKDICVACEMRSALSGEDAFDVASERFAAEVAVLDPSINEAELNLSHAFDFLERAFGNEREMLVFTAELTARGSTARFINRFGSESYFAHNEGLMIDSHQQDLLARIDELGLSKGQQDEVVVAGGKDAGTAAEDAGENAGMAGEDVDGDRSAEEALDEEEAEGLSPEQGADEDAEDESAALEADASLADSAATDDSEDADESFAGAAHAARPIMDADEEPAGLDDEHREESDAGDAGEEGEEEVPSDQATGETTLQSYYTGAQFEYGLPSLCKMTLPADLEGKTVLDIGCRRGKGVFKLSDRVGENGHVIGIDWTPAFVEEASERMDRAWHDSGLPRNNMEIHLGYPEALDEVGIPDSSVDVIFVNSVSNLVYDDEAAYREMLRVLKDGGYVVNETVIADRARDANVVEKAKAIGNSVQAATDKSSFENMLSRVGFRTVSYDNAEPVDPDAGALPQIPADQVDTDEDVHFAALVATIVK